MNETTMIEPNTDNQAGIKWALGALKDGANDYAQAVRYYDGRHPLNFATDKFRNAFGRLFQELAINFCPICVDVPADRLQIEGFTVVSEGEENPQVADKIAEIWRRNRMNKRSGEVHKEAFKCGDSYVIVDEVDEKAVIHPNGAGRCAVKYDDENPGYVKEAAKWWHEEVEYSGGGKVRYKIRLNLYYRDRTEKYETAARTTTDLPSKATEFKPIEGDWYIPNVRGKVPVFHYPNNADIGKKGKSEIEDIIPPQNGLNKSVCDMLVGMEYGALKQRYVAGLEVAMDDNGNPIPPFMGGTSTLWVAPPQKDETGKPLPAGEAQPISFGEFSAADLEQFISVKKSFRQDISAISGIPIHYFMDGGGTWPSGESLKTAEQRLTAKIADRQIAFGNVWEDVMRYCLEIEGINDVHVAALWKDTSPRSDKEEVETAAVKVEKLGISKKQSWRELGYQESEIEQIDEENEAVATVAITQRDMAIVPTVGRNLNGSRQAA